MKNLIFMINGNMAMTEETLRRNLANKTWSVILNPIADEKGTELYKGKDIDMVMGTISTPNWGEYTVTQVVESTENNVFDMFGFKDEPTSYTVKCFELL